MSKDRGEALFCPDHIWIGIHDPALASMFFVGLFKSRADWLGLGSDHTDRKVETMGIALSKQLCAKVVGTALWPLSDVIAHWDRLKIRSYAVIDGKRTLYQQGELAAMHQPSDLLSRYDGSSALSSGAVMFCGTVGAIDGIRPASRFEMELEDPILGRKLMHAYDIINLPIVS